MATLKNESARGLGLPAWGKRAAMVLVAGATIEVPDDYVDHLRAEVPGVAGFFGMPRGGIVVQRSARLAADVAEQLRASEPDLDEPAAADGDDGDTDTDDAELDELTDDDAPKKKPKKKRTR